MELGRRMNKVRNSIFAILADLEDEPYPLPRTPQQIWHHSDHTGTQFR